MRLYQCLNQGMDKDCEKHEVCPKCKSDLVFPNAER